MREKKQFKWSNPELEELYLSERAKMGFIFEKYENEWYVFKEAEPQDLDYLVEYNLEPKENNRYDDQGLKCIFVYPSSHGGTFSYFVREAQDTPIKRLSYDHLKLSSGLLKNVETRYLPIIGVSMLAALFMSYQYRSVYLYITVAILVMMFIYLLYLRNRLKKIQKNNPSS